MSQGNSIFFDGAVVNATTLGAAFRTKADCSQLDALVALSTGPTGATGPAGKDGLPGPIGLGVLVPWQASTVYSPGPLPSYVSYQGSSYVCQFQHTSTTFAADFAKGFWGTVASGTLPDPATLLAAVQSLLGQPNGIATLDSSARLLSVNIPFGLITGTVADGGVLAAARATANAAVAKGQVGSESVTAPNGAGIPTAQSVAAWVTANAAAAAAAQATAVAAVPTGSDAALKSLQLAPTSPLTSYGFGLSRALSGSSSVGINGSIHNTTGDTAAITGPNFLNGYTVQHSFGGATVQGGRQAHFDLLIQTAPASANSVNRNYVAHSGSVSAQSGDGGTDTNTGALGAYFAENPVAVAGANAKNLYELTGGEVNVAAQAGSSVKHKALWSLVWRNDDAVQGDATDAMLLFGAQGGAIGSRDGILFGNTNGAFPLVASATMFRSVAGTVATGIDLSALTISGKAITTPGFSVDGAGNAITKSITAASANINGSATVANYGQGGGTFFSMTGGASGQQSLSLVGRGAAASPYWVTPDNFVIRSQGGGTIDINAPTTATAPAAGSAGALPSAPAGYFTVIVGNAPRQIAYY